jgi:hypothetical protein
MRCVVHVPVLVFVQARCGLYRVQAANKGGKCGWIVVDSGGLVGGGGWLWVISPLSDWE